MTRRSLNDSPGDSLRTFCSACSSARLARLDDQVADAELLDERHHLLLRAGADRQHRDDRRHAEDHPEHRQQRAQLVRAEVLEAEHQLGQEVGRPEMGAGAAHFAGPDAVGSGPADEDLVRCAATSGSISAITSPSFDAGERGAALGAVGDLDVAPLEPIAASGGRRRSCRSSRTPPGAAPAARWGSRGRRSPAARWIRRAGADPGFSNVNVDVELPDGAWSRRSCRARPGR